jgi:type VI secretion system protein ImpJ
MDFKKSIFWHQGLFLQPQHFQLLELQSENSKKPLFEFSSPYNYGVGDLLLSTDILNTRAFEVRNAKLIFQDQTYIEFPGNAVINTRSFDKVWVDNDQPLKVYLGLKKLSNVAPNVTVIDSLDQALTVSTRMVSLSDGEECPDLYTSAPPAHIATVQYVVRIFFELEIETLEDHHLIPIALLVRDSNSIKLVSQFVPPCYRISGSQMLTDIVKDIRDDLAGRLRQLEQYKAPKASTENFTPQYFVLFQLLLSLNRLVPAIFHITENPYSHPWDIYGLLRTITGEISSFSENVDVFGKRKGSAEPISTYDHLNLGPSFTKAKIQIEQLLNQIAVGPEFIVLMEKGDNYFEAKIPEEIFIIRNHFYIIVQSSFNLMNSVPIFNRIARLAAPSRMPLLMEHALPGVDLSEITIPPQGLPIRSDSRYFRIEQTGSEWEYMDKENTMALFWPDAPEDLCIEIVVLKR